MVRFGEKEIAKEQFFAAKKKKKKKTIKIWDGNVDYIVISKLI